MNDLNCTAAAGDFDGVRITANNVVFHLAKYTISSPVCDQSRNITGIFVGGGGISGVKIDGGSVSGFNDGIVLSSSNSSVFGTKISGACLSGIHVQGSGNHIEKNTATGNGDGVSLLSTVNAFVRGNNLSGNLRNGVSVSGDGTNNNFVEDNIINNNGATGGYGVAVFNGTNTFIRDNAVNDNRNGIFLDASGNRVLDNTINGSADVGISVGTSVSQSVIRRNTVLSSGNTDMSDNNAACGGNLWRNNTITTDLAGGAADGGPNAGCIR